MDYQNRAGSKKGSGGVASASQENLHRRKQVDQLLSKGEDVPYTFQEAGEDDEKLRKNPYIYKNHSGKLVCKLCNTMHMSWSSVERHLGGKKHGLNLLRRGGIGASTGGDGGAARDSHFQKQVEETRAAMKRNGIVPECKMAKVRDSQTGYVGLALKVNYQGFGNAEHSSEDVSPYVRVMSGLELPGDDNDDKKYLVVAHEPFENVAVEIPNREIVMNTVGTGDTADTAGVTDAVDELNGRCGYWDRDRGSFYVQIFFK